MRLHIGGRTGEAGLRRTGTSTTTGEEAVIYTLGTKKTYDAALDIKAAEGKPLLKVGRGTVKGVPYEGGSVWETRAEVQAYIDGSEADPERMTLRGYAVYGVEADWKRDTVKAPGDVPWRSLKRDAIVVALESEEG